MSQASGNLRRSMGTRLMMQGRLVLAGVALGLLARWIWGSPLPDPVRRFSQPMPEQPLPAASETGEIPDLPLILRRPEQ